MINRKDIHESAYIDNNVSIGNNTKVWHFSHICENVRIGNDCIIGQNVMIGPDVKIGNKCKIQNNVSVFKGVQLGNGVFCGPSCVFTNVVNPRAEIEKKKEFKKTIIEDGVTIGANATIICGLEIGEYSFIGAGAVVTKNVLPYSLIVGVPGKKICWVNKEGNKLSMKDTKGLLIKNFSKKNKERVLKYFKD